MEELTQQEQREIRKAEALVRRRKVLAQHITDEVLDVTYVEFPMQKAQVVIHIGEDNAETEYQLFYLTDGELINARNVTNMGHILGANTFL